MENNYLCRTGGVFSFKSAFLFFSFLFSFCFVFIIFLPFPRMLGGNKMAVLFCVAHNEQSIRTLKYTNFRRLRSIPFLKTFFSGKTTPTA